MKNKFRNQSAEYACDRMKVLLMSERIHCSQQKIKLLEYDLIHTIKQYFDVIEKQVQIEILQDPLSIVVTIPVIKIRNEDIC